MQALQPAPLAHISGAGLKCKQTTPMLFKCLCLQADRTQRGDDTHASCYQVGHARSTYPISDTDTRTSKYASNLTNDCCWLNNILVVICNYKVLPTASKLVAPPKTPEFMLSQYTITRFLSPPAPLSSQRKSNTTQHATHVHTNSALPDQRRISSTYWVQQCLLRHQWCAVRCKLRYTTCNAPSMMHT